MWVTISSVLLIEGCHNLGSPYLFFDMTLTFTWPHILSQRSKLTQFKFFNLWSNKTLSGLDQLFSLWKKCIYQFAYKLMSDGCFEPIHNKSKCGCLSAENNNILAADMVVSYMIGPKPEELWDHSIQSNWSCSMGFFIHTPRPAFSNALLSCCLASW